LRMNATLRLGKQGRVVIPADIRAALGLSPGDRIHVRLDGPRIVMEKPADAIDEIRALGREKATNRSLVDELLAERRTEVRDN
jgi:AbrB family looped-hinge helix DNA binding protein